MGVRELTYGEAVREAELGAQQLVHRAHDVGNHRARGVEDAALHALLGVVLLEEEFVEVDDRVFLRVAVTEVADDGLHVGVVEQLHDLAHAEFVEVVTEGDHAIASVRLSGQLRENDGAPENFDEIWNVQKSLRDARPAWLLAGIQQIS